MNKCWHTRTIPQDWKHAIVVNIYKGSGPSQDPIRYRPISLLNVLYKLYARMIQKRLAAHVDKRILDTQYGFRRGKSTGDPIHIIRRIQEMFEATSSPLHMVFLDWSVAFDKLSHTGLVSALTRFGIPQHYVEVIKDIYTSPTFQVRESNNLSPTCQQGSGIRQGCPLSPYLFIIFVSQSSW